MGTKNNPGTFDCYDKAAPDEPHFTLLGRDRHAPLLVRLWAILRVHDGEAEAVTNEAFACAKAMHSYCVSQGKMPAPAVLSAATHIELLYQRPELGSILGEYAMERRRQIAIEGFTLASDDRYRDGSMALAAACYAMFASVSDTERQRTDLSPGLSADGRRHHGAFAMLELWPWAREWWKPKDRRRDLMRAAALITAEIERLDRKAATAKTET